MADEINIPEISVPLTRAYEVDTLPSNRLIKFDLLPDEAEIEALKLNLGLTGLKKMRMVGEISPLGAKSWLLDAELGATVSQICVISAEPVRTRIDVSVRIKFLPENKIEFDTPENELDDEVEQLEKTIDIGIIATEALSLAVPLYPRKEGAEMQNAISAPAGQTPMTDEQVKPFAGLAALREKLESKPE